MQEKVFNSEAFQACWDYLVQAGPSKARQVCGFLKISQPSFSRLIAQNDSILRMGRGPQTLYAARRLGAWGKSTIPVCTIDKTGILSHKATLHPIKPKGIYVE